MQNSVVIVSFPLSKSITYVRLLSHESYFKVGDLKSNRILTRGFSSSITKLNSNELSKHSNDSNSVEVVIPNPRPTSWITDQAHVFSGKENIKKKIDDR